MPLPGELHAAIDAAIKEAESVRKVLRQRSGRQVRSAEERTLLRATALGWFNRYRLAMVELVPGPALAPADNLYRRILEAADKRSSRASSVQGLGAVRPTLAVIRSDHVIAPAPSPGSVPPPDFRSLVGDPAMQRILERRWVETTACLAGGAPLAATVMMGGLLEALLLARVNREPTQVPVFKARTAPKDKKSNNPLPLKEWTLKNYIDVAHELGWISHSAKNVGEVLRDYRNYVHPYKELSQGVNLTLDDAVLLWGIAKNIADQLVR